MSKTELRTFVEFRGGGRVRVDVALHAESRWPKPLWVARVEETPLALAHTFASDAWREAIQAAAVGEEGEPTCVVLELWGSRAPLSRVELSPSAFVERMARETH